MALPTAAAGAIKGATAKNMALFAKTMEKTDWDGVNNAMQSIKDFGASASLVQETLGSINEQASSLADIALGTILSKVAEKASELFDKLEPIASLIDRVAAAFVNLDNSVKLEELLRFIDLLNVFFTLLESGRINVEKLSEAFGKVFLEQIVKFFQQIEQGIGAFEAFLDLFGTILGWLLGVSTPSGGGGGGGDGLPRGKFPVEGF